MGRKESNQTNKIELSDVRYICYLEARCYTIYIFMYCDLVISFYVYVLTFCFCLGVCQPPPPPPKKKKKKKKKN